MANKHDITRIPPQSIDSEQATLGSILQDPYAALYSMDVLDENDFYLDAHKFIFRAMKELFEEKIEIDQLTVVEKLSRMKLIDDIGGPAVIANLINRVPSSANIKYYSKIVLDKAYLRNIISSGNNMIDKAFNEENDPEEIVQEAQSSILKLGNKKKNTFSSPKDVLPGVIIRMEEIATSGIEPGVQTGFNALNEMTGGWQKQDLIIIAGRPSMGKTALAISMMKTQLKENCNIGFFSMEMSKEQIIQRFLSQETGINLMNIIRGKITKDDWPTITEASQLIHGYNLKIDPEGALFINQIRSRARLLHQQLQIKTGHGLDIIYVDYMQLGHAKISRNDQRNHEVAAISNGLKSLGKEIDIPVVALSQLSRAPEARSDHRPELSDLRDSGAIEQDADIVMFIDRPYQRTHLEEDKNKAELIISKHRNGPVGDIPLYFYPETALFRSEDHRYVGKNVQQDGAF